jgi:hypothetical protein
MPPPIIALAIVCSLFTLVIRVIISRPPFRIKNVWSQIFSSLTVAVIIWITSIFFIKPASPISKTEWRDIVCGILIFLNAFWCHYWIGNFAGGFRVQMQINLASQKRPISIEEWMNTFGGLGMEAFLRDRLQSILIPWNTVKLEGGQLRLRAGWGIFFGRLMRIVKNILPKVRGN